MIIDCHIHLQGAGIEPGLIESADALSVAGDSQDMYSLFTDMILW